MNITALFIRRPIGTMLLMAAVVLVGAISYRFLPVASLPDVDFPTIQVQGALPGASPETMASAVATPLERQFSRIAGVTQMTSSSLLGTTNITLQFDLNRNIDAAARDVQAAINAASGQLPPNLPNLPTYRKVNPADSPILFFQLISDTLPLSRLYDVADTIVAQKFAQVKGVGQVNVQGSARPAVRVELNPSVLASYGLGLEDVRTALSQVNANVPKGSLWNGMASWVLSADDQLFGASRYRPLIIAYRHGAPVRLGDIATVQDSVENIYSRGLVDGKTAILISIMRQPSANIVATVDAVLATLPIVRASIPAAMNLDVEHDRTTMIRASVTDIKGTLVTTVALVVLVIFIFLRDLRSTIILSIAVPISLVGTFSVMYLCGYSLDNLSLMALTIVTGFVVDDAIVVIENINRYLEAGLTPFQAALKGSREIGFTVVSMSSSLMAVFIPILLMGGIVGRLFREFAVTLCVAVGMSLLVSLTATPALCAKFLRPQTEGPHNFLYRFSQRGFDGLLARYRSALGWVLQHQLFTLGVTMVTLCLSLFLYYYIPKGFFPEQDTGAITGAIQASQDISFESMALKQRQFNDIVMADPAVKGVTCNVGGGQMNTGSMIIHLKPLAERKVGVIDVLNRLRRKLAVVPGATLFMQAQQDIQIGGRLGNSQYQFTLQSEDLSELNRWAPIMLEKLKTLPGLRDVSTDQQVKGLQASLVIDRDTASRLGIPTQMIDNTLYDAFGQRLVSTVFTQMNEYHVVMEVAPEFQRSPEALSRIYARSTNGTQVPLSAFTHYESSRTSLAVNHQGQYPAITLSFNLAPGVALGDAAMEVENAEEELGMPSSIRVSFQGAAQAFQDTLKNQPVLILAALVAVYIVLGMLYESFIHPITILSTLPSAGVGALLALFICRIELSVIALIGIILLIGIVKKNAIMMVDFAIATERKTGKSPEDSIYEACLLRFRPIMMTTMAALLGALPLALGTGTGSELRRPLGISILGGLIVSQMLTLFTTPVVYLYMDRLGLRLTRHRGASTTATIRPDLQPSSAFNSPIQ
jgi:multidrug efflux pump